MCDLLIRTSKGRFENLDPDPGKKRVGTAVCQADSRVIEESSSKVMELDRVEKPGLVS